MKRSDINQMVNMQYIYSAMEILASAFDYSVNILHMKEETFLDIFFFTNIYMHYEIRSPKYMVGMSGRELVLCLLDKAGYTESFTYDFDYVNFFKTKEYWAMYMITYYKYIKNLYFKEIFNIISISEIIKMYNTLHEASFDKFVSIIDKIIKKRGKDNLRDKLVSARLRKKISQKELSLMSGVNLRTLQKYETGEKDINKAEYQSVNSLERVLLGIA